jgi:hypothetical protein
MSLLFQQDALFAQMEKAEVGEDKEHDNHMEIDVVTPVHEEVKEEGLLDLDFL